MPDRNTIQMSGNKVGAFDASGRFKMLDEALLQGDTTFTRAGFRRATDDELRQQQSLSNQKIDVQTGAVKLPFNIGESDQSPVSSTEQMRAQDTANQAATADMLGSLGDMNINSVLGDTTAFADTPEAQDALARIEEARNRLSAANLGEFTDEQQSIIDQAGEAAGAEFDPLIAQAEEDMRRGMPKALISGGERGGFMSTQIAGQAALVPTVGGDFIGAGGELKNIENDYNFIIKDLKAKKQQAILAAKDAARKYQQTGAKSDYDAAQELFDRAKTMYDSEQKAIADRVDLIANYQKIAQAQTKFITEQQDVVFERLGEIAKAGGSIPSDIQAQVDSIYGNGFTEQYYIAEQMAQAAETEADNIKLAKTVVDIVDKIPEGQEISIGGTSYMGMRQGNNKVYREVRPDNTTAYVTIDENGEVVSVAEGIQVKGTSSGGSGGGGGTQSNAVTDLVNQVLATRGSDGFLNTETYRSALESAASMGEKEYKEFITRLPGNRFLNPQDATAKTLIGTPSQVFNLGDTGDGFERDENGNIKLF